MCYSSSFADCCSFLVVSQPTEMRPDREADEGADDDDAASDAEDGEGEIVLDQHHRLLGNAAASKTKVLLGQVGRADGASGFEGCPRRSCRTSERDAE